MERDTGLEPNLRVRKSRELTPDHPHFRGAENHDQLLSPGARPDAFFSLRRSLTESQLQEGPGALAQREPRVSPGDCRCKDGRHEGLL